MTGDITFLRGHLSINFDCKTINFSLFKRKFQLGFPLLHRVYHYSLKSRQLERELKPIILTEVHCHHSKLIKSLATVPVVIDVPVVKENDKEKGKFFPFW